MKKILICGAGLVGGPMALDMAGDPDTTVTVADKCPASLRRLEGRTNLLTQQADLSDEKQLAHLAADKDLVISAVPGFMGFGTLRNLIRLKKMPSI